ncbi:acyl-CoA dehydrogenase [Desulfitobacterium metallireducens]|uniref:Medium-chain specific acyl-CoA dehydrogenase, mitochondrial n=1 Tax=Desulfitobacterium metallireducens DSM 15288 TaxID=871968 RepID=W0ECV0_9FIRM|nr:acyl-CoA dehydrogenase [Desulfitobacterium metallireducens]AHF07348.1 acyl-CoA dehydrogenase [Desulfitobacterium metallireducens DSM 15288]
MDFRLTEEQELLLESLREIMARDCTEEYMKECNELGQYPTRFVKALMENGFGMLGVPEEYDGTPVDTMTMMLVAEEITKNGGPHFVFGQALSIADMLEFGSEEQKTDTMREVQAGNVAFVLGFTEPQAGSDSSAIATTFTRKNGKVYINGHKTFMSNALRAPYMLCLARNSEEVNDADKRNAFTMWWVPMNVPGVKVEKLKKIGWHMMDTCEVYLENVELEEKDLVGVEGKGFIQAMINFEVERLYIAAAVMGMAECAFEDAARYANQRVQFGKTIGSQQLIQEKLTYMKLKIENMKNMVYKCAWEIDNGISVQVSSALAKLYCAQASCEVIDDALQIMGGIGYTTDCRISRLWVDSRVHRIGGGTDEVMVHVAGRAILKQFK